MTPEEAFAQALEGAAILPEVMQGSPGRPTGLLSPRELEVLSLVAEGHSDAEIAGRLYLSVRTIGNNLGSTYRKLGVKSRTAAVRRAVELGLI